MAIDNSLARHVVAVIGGATAGSEVAHILAERGALVAVIEQNSRSFGKIEDGLPRWHAKQRKDEYEADQLKTVPSQYRVCAADAPWPRSQVRRPGAPLGTQRRCPGQRRLARSALSGRRRRPVHRSRADLSEPADLLVQSLSGKELPGSALRTDARRRRGGRRAGVDRRREGVSNSRPRSRPWPNETSRRRC